MVVEAQLANKSARFINGYGNQENEDESIRKEFFNQLDEDIERAKVSDSLICVELDANVKLGANVIIGDPNKEMSPNGKLNTISLL